MNIRHQTYSGQIFRPKPEIFAEENGSLIVIATPWGPRSGAEKAIQIIQDYYLSAREDLDATSPFPKLSCLSSAANNLRVAVMIANEVLYREENRNEYRCGIELFAAARSGQEIHWIQVGMPNLLIDRAHFPLVPIGLCYDLSFEMSSQKKIMHPLPGELHGLDPTSNMKVHSLVLQGGDNLLLVSRSILPSSIFSLKKSERDMSQLALELSNSDANMPFWIASVSLD